MFSRCQRALVLLAVLAFTVSPVRAQSDARDTTAFTGKANVVALAKASQNPIGTMAAVPFQNRFGWNTGPDDRFHYVLNLLPVFPTGFGDGVLLVPQLTMPFVYQDLSLTEVRSGIGDAQFQALLAPRDPYVVSAGIGAAMMAPTATSKGTGFGKWSAGPAAAIVATPGPWVVGTSVKQLWSFAGQSDRAPVSALTIEPFINYNMPGGWTILSAPIITADFEAPSDERWTLPVGAGMSKTIAFPLQAMRFDIAAYANVIRPTTASSWELRILYSLLYPR